jgi:hypothetical protein
LHPRSRLTQWPLCPTSPGAFVRYKTHCDHTAHNLFLFIPPALPSLVRHARAACVCLCSTAHKRGVCAPAALCGACCWWAGGTHQPAAAAACQSFFYDFYKKLTELSANSFCLLFCWLVGAQLPGEKSGDLRVAGASPSSELGAPRSGEGPGAGEEREGGGGRCHLPRPTPAECDARCHWILDCAMMAIMNNGNRRCATADSTRDARAYSKQTRGGGAHGLG